LCLGSGEMTDLTNQLLRIKQNLINASIYVDYENIYELLKEYGKTPLEINFFSVILQKLQTEHQLNVVDFMVYCNFEKNTFDRRHQTELRGLGLQTRHSANNGKNSGDLELTVDALRTLYKNSNIDVFVIISSDRDIIPLIKAIKYENKIAYVLSTKIGFNRIVAKYADHHEYIEDIFGLSDLLRKPHQNPEDKVAVHFDGSNLDPNSIARAQEVSKLFYESKVWQRSKLLNEPISLNGYVNIIAKTITRLAPEIIEDFKLAHYLGYIQLYKDAKKGMCIEEGPKKEELPLE
jgi:uncharacterized LabA/DUF88 family protein